VRLQAIAKDAAFTLHFCLCRPAVLLAINLRREDTYK
jgi:hypothetical protein